MIEKLLQIAKKNKEKIVYKIESDEITYGELLKRAEELAKSLENQGMSPVIIYGHKQISMLVSIVACLIAKRAYVPVDTYMPKERIYEIIKLSNANLIIKNEAIDINAIECLSVEEINKKYNGITEKTENKNEIAYIIFTSGSTGAPKGVPISYSNLENFISWISNLDGLKEYKNITVLNQANFSFDLSVADIYYTLFNGHTLVGLKNTDNYEKILEIIKCENINLMVVTPTFIKLLLLDNIFNSKDLPSLKCIYFCGETLEVQTVKKIRERFENIKIINAYGPTEATSAVSAVVVDDKMLEKEYLPVRKIKYSSYKDRNRK